MCHWETGKAVVGAEPQARIPAIADVFANIPDGVCW
jgi:hypothetical protein